MGFSGRTSLIGCKIGVQNRLPGELLRFGRLRLLGVPAPRRSYRCHERRHHVMAVSRRDESLDSVAVSRSRRRGLPANRPRDFAQRADLGRTNQIAQGRRRRPHLGPHVHRARRRARAPHEARAAGRSQWRRALSLRSGRQERRRQLAGHRGRADDEHPRGALPGGDPQALRCARGHRQRRNGRQDARRPAGIRVRCI